MVVSSSTSQANRLAHADPCASCAARILSVCSTVPDQYLDQLAAIITTKTFVAHDQLIDEGDPADVYFNLTSGAAKLVRYLPDGRQQILGFLFAGDFVGLAQREHYSYGVVALNTGTACRIRRADLDRLIERFPDLGKQLGILAGEELAVAQEQMVSLGRKTARERVASFLLQISKRRQRLGLPSDPVELAMTRGDMADYLGLTIETVSRTVSALKRDGIIALEGSDTVRLVDRAHLDRLGEGWE